MVQRWPDHSDTTLRLIRAIAVACKAEPALNAWFDGQNISRRLLEKVHVGIAVDSAEGLFVPVLRDVANRTSMDLRQGLDALRADVESRSIPPEELQGATILLTNFGTIAGRYATPLVIPPTVTIIGAGVIRPDCVALAGIPQIVAVLPLSISFDHRSVTGGETARFLKALISNLELPE